ncbi:MAG: hypothetical protein KKA60_07645 [Proteobacteria bacterium]|nr:hypothetical protein [Pseudomonadota bacterium]
MDFKILGRQDRNKLKTQLRYHARQRRVVLIIPCLASEFNEEDNLPVFENILNNLRQVSYLYKIIFGLDAATPADAVLLGSLVRKHEIKNAVIQWNRGPVFSEIYDKLSEVGFVFSEEGKGKNMFLSFGLAMAMGAHSVAVLDADIRTFDRVQLDRLLYPVVVLDYDFSKAYYERVSQSHLYGRVKRLLLIPLLVSLKRRFYETQDSKMRGMVDFLLQFRYPLSGEVAFHVDLLRKMRFATNWGVEIFTLIEVYRKASSAAQVHFSEEPFDHKHQVISESDESKGLHRMAIDIVATLMNALVREEGLEITDSFFRDLSVTYKAVAEGQIKGYSELSRFNSLLYDRDAEEHLVKTVFTQSVLTAGEMLTSRRRVAENFLKVVHTYPEFAPYLETGLADAILSVESQLDKSLFEIPQTVSWERVNNKLPYIYTDLLGALKKSEALLG